MSTEKQEGEKELTAEQNLNQMKDILKNYTSKRKAIGREIKKTTSRLEGAAEGDRDVLIRRFQFDLRKLREELAQAKGKEEWAKRMIDSIEQEMHTREVILIEDGELVLTTELIHRPFAKALVQLQA